ncbi:hypothetical protein [Nocardia uniformis]|nr:hypothetical protein [Nocardia uniformis]
MSCPLIFAMDRIPALAGLTAYVGGIGIRPEHAPEFARRQRTQLLATP